MYTRHAGPLAIALLAGCTPGSIAWSTGEDELRTAMYVVERPTPATERVRLFLSNGDLGDLGCTMPDAEGDAAEVADGWDRMWFALCREDARHVYVDLYRPIGSAVEATYEATDGSELRERPMTGFYAGIDEANTSGSDSLVQDYDVVEATWGDLGVDGRLTVDGSDEAPPSGDWTTEATVTTRIRGTFSFPDLHVSGEFGARLCEPSPERVRILDFLETVGFTPDVPVDPALWCNR